MRFPQILLLSILVPCSAVVCRAADDYKPGPDSLPQAGVAKGEILKGQYAAKEGSVFPGTEREYTIYLPVGLDKTKPAPFMVFQDGVMYQGPTVFDNLIAKKEIPPLVGIFIKPGVVPAVNANALPRFNRSYEYDSVTDAYSKFLIEEFLPAIIQKHGLNLSTDPNDAAITGNSSGGIAAFMVAWHRPDRFRRVFSGVGTYVGIHGADQLPVLLRKTEPKPLRVYLQSGTGDNNLYCGDWWMANQTMERSLIWAGYEVNHSWGDGGHNAKQATAIFPDVLRWLWHGWPEEKPLVNGRKDSKWLGFGVLGEGSAWETAAETKQKPWLTVDAKGEVAGTGDANARTLLFGGKQAEAPPQGAATTLSPDQTLLYATRPASPYVESFQVSPEGKLSNRQDYFQLEAEIDGRVEAGGMCVDTEGRLYVATAMGVQVCDQAGRVNFIIPTPEPPQDVCFGGKDLGELFIACGDKIYKRATQVHGVVSGQMAPMKPVAPHL